MRAEFGGRITALWDDVIVDVHGKAEVAKIELAQSGHDIVDAILLGRCCHWPVRVVTKEGEECTQRRGDT